MADRFYIFKNKKVLLGIAAAVVLILAAAAYMLFPGKSARDFYLKAEGRNFKIYSDMIKKTYKDFKEAQQPYLSANYKVRTEISADIKQKDAPPAVSGIYDVLGKCKLVADYQCNPVEKTSLTGLSLLLEKSPFVDAEIISRDKQLYFTVPVFTPGRYFGVDTERLDEVYDRFKAPVKPLRVPNPTDAANAVEFDSEEFERLASDYGKYISEHLKDKDVKYGKTVDLTISGEKTGGREVFVSLGKEDSLALLKGLAAKAGSDDAFVKLTYGNYADVSGVVDAMGIFQLINYLDRTKTLALNEEGRSLLKAFDITKDLDGFKQDLSKLFDSFNMTDGLKMTLIIDKAGNILDRTVTAKLKDTAGAEHEINIHTGTNSVKYNDYRNRYLKADIYTRTAGGETHRYFGINPAVTPSSKDGDVKGRLDFYWGIDVKNGIYSLISAKLDIDTATDPLTLKKNSLIKYAVEQQNTKEGTPDKISGEINTVSWKNNKMKTRNKTTDITFNAELPNFGITGFSAGLKLAREDRLELEPFTLPEVPSGSLVDLNTATDEELQKVQNEILASFGTFYMTNKPIIDAVMGQ